jgi:hypothetical protein
VLRFLDGGTSLVAVARASGLDLEEVRAVVEPLYAEGLLGERTDVPLPAPVFFDHARNSGLLWQEADNRFMGAVAEGTASAKLVLGMLIEEWHYIRSNPSHASAAVLHARTPRTEQLWAQFAAEEYPHGGWLREGLARVLSEDELGRCRPLPGTVALCCQMRHVARASELGYAACLALGEQSAAAEGEGDQVDYYRALMRPGLLPEGVFEPFLRHALTDVRADHLEFTRVPFEEHAPLKLAERKRILGHVWDHVRAYELFHAHTFAFYSDPQAPRIHASPDEAGP